MVHRRHLRHLHRHALRLRRLHPGVQQGPLRDPELEPRLRVLGHHGYRLHERGQRARVQRQPGVLRERGAVRDGAGDGFDGDVGEGVGHYVGECLEWAAFGAGVGYMVEQ